jgi:peptide/nickel transport system permease protein
LTVITQTPDSPEIVESGLQPQRGVFHDAWRVLRRDRWAMISLWITGFYLLAGLASFLPIMERAVTIPISKNSYDPPHWGSPGVWFGTDIQGRSVFWRTVYGTRVALIITVITSIISLAIGTGLGIAAGYFGGWIDVVIVWLFTTLSSIPWILLVIAMAYALQSYDSLKALSGLPVVILALGLTDWVGLCRLLRGEVLKHRERDYVMAARAAGAGTPRILFRHILPNVFHLIIITFSLGAVGYVQAEVALTFLGLGISDRPSWGRMIDDSKVEMIRGVWWQLAAATAAIFVLCMALNFLGDALRDALDPRLHGVE